jgi:SusD family.
MKKINISLLLLSSVLILFSATSCSKWLDVPVEAKQPVSAIDYTDFSRAQEVLIGAYGQFFGYNGVGSWCQLAVMAVRGDDTEKGNPSPSDQITLTEFHNFNYASAPSFWALGNCWNGQYTVISQMNEAIASFQKFADNGADADKMKNYIAQVRVLRAYIYFRMARLFGAVPVFSTYDEQKASPRRSTFEHVMQYIIKEMDEAQGDLENVKPNKATIPGTVTKYTALAVKAKAAAEILDYDTVLSATNDIISAYGQSALVSDYTKVFDNEGNLSDENLLECQYSSLTNPQTSNDNYYAFQGPAHSIQSKVLFDGNNLGGGWGFLPPSAKLEKFLKDRGETSRYKTSILKVGELTFGGDLIVADASKPYPSMYSGKAYNPSTLTAANANWWGSNNSIKTIRYSDILLLNAEAKVKKGQNGDEPYNWVRKRAGMPTLTGVTFDQIMDERFAELCLENGERYYDLARTGLATTVLNGYTVDKRFYPIPQTALDTDKALLEDAI